MSPGGNISNPIIADRSNLLRDVICRAKLGGLSPQWTVALTITTLIYMSDEIKGNNCNVSAFTVAMPANFIKDTLLNLVFI